jgi:tetratricopeptide (TPR) repeat protein
VRSAEKVLAEGLQRYPNNSQLKAAEADLATALEQSDRVFRALNRAFVLNPRNNYIAMRLAQHYTSNGRFDEAIKTLRTALEARPGDIRLNYAYQPVEKPGKRLKNPAFFAPKGPFSTGCYAKLLVESGSQNADEILYHAQLSYTPGDMNYDGQFLHARQLFVMGKARESRPLFKILRQARMDPFTKRMPRMPMNGTFTGVIDKLEAIYARIRRDGDGEWVFINRERVAPPLWNSFSIGTSVRFEIWFSMYGAIALGIELR